MNTKFKQPKNPCLFTIAHSRNMLHIVAAWDWRTMMEGGETPTLTWISHHDWAPLEGRGFSPAGIARPALCLSRSPRSSDVSGLRGTREMGMVGGGF